MYNYVFVLPDQKNVCFTQLSLSVLCNAMVTNHLRAPYGVYFTKNRTILRRPCGARPAAGRIVRFFIKFLDIVRCPVKFRYYLKFHGARTAFGRVNEGKITSTGHRTGTGRCPSGHRTMPVRAPADVL